jgi:ABC-type branched-subunit amino acid transport system substrate-binding protein
MTTRSVAGGKTTSSSFRSKMVVSVAAVYTALTLFGCATAPELERNHVPSPALAENVVRATVLPIESTFNERSGVTDTQIRIGSCCALTGPAALLGTQLVRGAQAYLNFINESGGVNGRQIKLITYDDGYDPIRAIRCFNQLLKENIFAGAFFVGTPTAAKYVPMAETRQVPLVGLFTGAQLLHEPFRPHVISVRASSMTKLKSK